MIPGRIHRRLKWALNLHDWGYKEEASNMLTEIARYVTKPESEVSSNGIETCAEKEETGDGCKSFGFDFCI